MIIKGIKPDKGIFFAVWPRRVRGVGLVAFEWLHYTYVEGTGWGDGGGWEYTRWVPEARYQAGERAQSPRSCGQCGDSHCGECNG